MDSRVKELSALLTDVYKRQPHTIAFKYVAMVNTKCCDGHQLNNSVSGTNPIPIKVNPNDTML